MATQGGARVISRASSRSNDNPLLPLARRQDPWGSHSASLACGLCRQSLTKAGILPMLAPLKTFQKDIVACEDVQVLRW